MVSSHSDYLTPLRKQIQGRSKCISNSKTIMNRVFSPYNGLQDSSEKLLIWNYSDLKPSGSISNSCADWSILDAVMK